MNKKLRTFGLAAGSIVAMCGFVVACSDDSSTGGSTSSSGGSSGASSSGGSSGGGSSGASSSGGSSSGSAGDECAIAPGTYTQTMTRKSGDTVKCPEPPPTDIVIAPSDGGGVETDAGSDCTIDVDTATCTSTTECTIKASGFTTTSKGTFDSKQLKGTQYRKTVQDSDGSVVSECEYEYSWTKK